MRKFLISMASVGLVLALTAAPAAAGKTGKPKATIVEKVVTISGASGFDNDAADFDILRDAVVATGLDGRSTASGGSRCSHRRIRRSSI